MNNLPIFKECDVMVVGGGPAGCAAAIQSARTGADTLLVEQSGMLGGATVQQEVVVVLSQNAVDFQGIWHEYMAKLLELGGAHKEDFNFGMLRISSTLDPNVVRLVWDMLLEESGADLILHCHFVDVIKNGTLLEGVVVNTRQGLGIIRAKNIIDCTGDAIVCNTAGAEWEQGSEKSPCAMALTKVVRLGGISKDAGLKENGDKEKLSQIIDEEVAKGTYTSELIKTKRVLAYINKGRLIWRLPHRSEIMLVTSRVLNANPTTYADITRAEREGLHSMYEVFDFYKRFVPGCENAFIAHISNQIGVRSSRRVHGRSYITQEDAMNFKKCRDGIAKSSWQLDVWPHDSYTKPAGNAGGIKDPVLLKQYEDRIRKGDYFDVPYGALLVKGFDNLMVAGRCISASHLAQASIRIQQTCMSTGQAAGYAAAKSVLAEKLPHELDGETVAKELEEIRNKTPLAMEELSFEKVAEHWAKMN